MTRRGKTWLERKIREDKGKREGEDKEEELRCRDAILSCRVSEGEEMAVRERWCESKAMSDGFEGDTEITGGREGWREGRRRRGTKG